MSYVDARIDNNGYEVLRKRDRRGRIIRLNVVVAEKALGGPLPKGAVVHHHNGIKADNRPANLVICPSQAYHVLLHQRMGALKACGRVDWRKCPFCKKYDNPANLCVDKKGHGRHKKCVSEYDAERRKNPEFRELQNEVSRRYRANKILAEIANIT